MMSIQQQKLTKYVYVVRGTATNWASKEDLRGVIEAILKECMPPGDVKNLSVEVYQHL